MLQNKKTPRLLEAAKEFNIGKETLVAFLKGKGFIINSYPNTKLTEKMYAVLQVQYQKIWTAIKTVKNENRGIEEKRRTQEVREKKVDKILIWAKTKKEEQNKKDKLKTTKHENTEGLSLEDQKKEVQKTINSLNAFVASDESKIKKLQDKILTLQKENQKEKLLKHEFQALTNDITETQLHYKKLKAEATLKLNSHYQDKLKRKKELIIEIQIIPNEKEIQTLIQQIIQKIGYIRKNIDQYMQKRNILLQQDRELEQETLKKRELEQEKNKRENTKRTSS